MRWRNEVIPERYLAVGSISTEEALDAETLLRERIMLGLRVEDGIDMDAIAADLGIPAWTPERTRALAWLLERGRIDKRGSKLRIPRAAWLWTDDTAARLF